MILFMDTAQPIAHSPNQATSRPVGATANTVGIGEQHVVPVVEEQLVVSRRVVDSGRPWRVRKVVDEETVQVDEPTFIERVDIKRVPVGRVLAEPVPTRHEGDVTIVPIFEERLVTTKQLVLIEELHISRRREQHAASQRVVLRREKALIERFDPDTGHWRVANEFDAATFAPGPDPPGGV